MTEKPSKPAGELVMKTIAMPADTNRYGDMFGGWLVSQMDLGGAVIAHQCSRLRMTTVAIDQMTFIRPVYVGDVVCCYGEIKKRGTSSVRVGVEVWVERFKEDSTEIVTQGLFSYVAIDKNGKPTPIQWRI